MRGFFTWRECLRCGLCCLETEMILTRDDIARIVRLGYRLRDFAEIRGGYWRLKNVDGHCVFYDPLTGRCSIYEHRPEGCRIYPLIYVEGEGFKLDPECPMVSEVSDHEVALAKAELIRLLRKLGVREIEDTDLT